MSDSKTIKVFIPLLEEGTPTIRGTEAMPLGGNLYRILPTSFYDPGDETWEFLPGSVVETVQTKSYKGEMILQAIALHDPTWIDIHVPVTRNGHTALQPAKAVDLGRDMGRLLKIENYDPRIETWAFAPGTVVRYTIDATDPAKRIAMQEITD